MPARGAPPTGADRKLPVLTGGASARAGLQPRGMLGDVQEGAGRRVGQQRGHHALLAGHGSKAGEVPEQLSFILGGRSTWASKQHGRLHRRDARPGGGGGRASTIAASHPAWSGREDLVCARAVDGGWHNAQVSAGAVNPHAHAPSKDGALALTACRGHPELFLPPLSESTRAGPACKFTCSCEVACSRPFGQEQPQSSFPTHGLKHTLLLQPLSQHPRTVPCTSILSRKPHAPPTAHKVCKVNRRSL